MSSIVLSASVRQNLLSLQSTASLLAQTQNRLATGNRVNQAFDNPTSFFTASSLNNRASDINNLLDGVSNGVKVLQAANTGISSLQKLVDAAKSVATQALQTTVGYSTKSAIETVAISGASAANLLGAAADATVTGSSATATSYYSDASTTGTVALLNNLSGYDSAVTTFNTNGANGIISGDTSYLSGNDFVVNGVTIHFSASATSTTGNASTGYTIGMGNGTTSNFAQLLAAVDSITGNTGTASSINGTGHLIIHTGTANDVSFAGSHADVLTLFGLSNVNRGTSGSSTALASTTKLSGTANTSNTVLTSGFANNDTITVNGQTLTFKTSGASGANQINITDDVSTLLGKIDGLSGGSGSAVSGGQITLHTGTSSNLSVTSSNAAALAALGLGTGVSQAVGGSSPLNNLTLTIGSTGGGTATSITFGNGAGKVATLDQLNNALAANHLEATVNSLGKIKIETTNEYASATIGAIGGTAAGSGNPFNGLAASAPVKDAAAQATRANLVGQYNSIVGQLTTTAQDASYNGVNLLNGDTLKLVFSETGKSTLNITGSSFDAFGLSLNKLTAGTDFIDNAATKKVMDALTAASRSLYSQASAFGSNLSILEIRKNFSDDLIEVLRVGASNLTLADTNDEAANSQALSTRQSIAVSAIALANQSQQSVLQLLR